jgi:hypothetical protein
MQISRANSKPRNASRVTFHAPRIRHKLHFHWVTHDPHQNPFDDREQPVLQPIPGEFVLGADDENSILAGDQPRVPDSGVESGSGHLQSQLAQSGLPDVSFRQR